MREDETRYQDSTVPTVAEGSTPRLEEKPLRDRHLRAGILVRCFPRTPLAPPVPFCSRCSSQVHADERKIVTRRASSLGIAHSR